MIPRSSTAERPAVNRQVIGSSPIAGAPGGVRRKRTGGPDRVPAPGCKKDGESGREHPAKALGWRSPAGPVQAKGAPTVPRSSTAERPAVNRQVIGSSPIAGAIRNKALPRWGGTSPPVAHRHPRGSRSAHSSPSRHPRGPIRRHSLPAAGPREDTTRTRPGRVKQSRDRRERVVDCAVASGRSRECAVRPAEYASAAPR